MHHKLRHWLGPVVNRDYATTYACVLAQRRGVSVCGEQSLSSLFSTASYSAPPSTTTAIPPHRVRQRWPVKSRSYRHSSRQHILLLHWNAVGVHSSQKTMWSPLSCVELNPTSKHERKYRKTVLRKNKPVWNKNSAGTYMFHPEEKYFDGPNPHTFIAASTT